MSYEELPLELISQEVVAEGDWRPCRTSGFFGDVKWKQKTARGWCEVKPEPGQKLIFKDLMRNQDRGICILLKEFTGADFMLETCDAVLEEKQRNDIQDDRIQALEHNVEVLMSHLPGHRSDSDHRDSAPIPLLSTLRHS